MTEVRVFTGKRGTSGTQANFPGGVFSTHENAEAWISEWKLSGILTLYRVDVGAYDFAIANGHSKPSKPEHCTSDFIGRFAGGDTHFHYEDGATG
jgi:hypothetical protein